MWLQNHKDYVFTYQIQGEPTKYKVKMIYISVGDSKPKFFFLDDRSLRDNPHFNEGFPENRSKFREEIERWQKGGAYRKTHPIITSRIEDLREQKLKLEEQLNRGSPFRQIKWFKNIFIDVRFSDPGFLGRL